mmetsp:Transcript_6291/g.13792  ORF Transcript_6291/g.13792 Transcript_6291/m.13792 type:complete len:273 (-) Transcript_6291:9-827(-)
MEEDANNSAAISNAGKSGDPVLKPSAAEGKRALGESMRNLLKNKAALKAQENGQKQLDGASSSNMRGLDAASTPKQGSEVSSQAAADWNQAFFDRMERDYEELCEADGWDKIKAQQDQLQETAPKPRHAEIPADSDYFRAAVPAGEDRELRPDPSAVMRYNAPLPARVQRNLEHLRKVEAATREAIEKELAKPKVGSGSSTTCPQSSPPLRSSSEKVVVETLSDSDDAAELQSGNTKEEQELYTALCALQEFERLGKAREERRERWRERYGD